jgi:histidine ammonia-lyase
VSVSVPGPSAPPIPLGHGAHLSLADLEAAARGGPVVLAEGARAALEASRQVVARQLEGDRPVYGVNTGFGHLADRRIAPADLQQLQVNLVRSHAAGVGPPLDREAVRAMLVLRAHALALGASGVRPELVERLVAFLNLDLVPRVPSLGSVGASGDLAPLAHMALCLIGEGEARRGPEGPWRPTADLLAEVGLSPLPLTAKEGLALTNGSQLTTALTALAAAEADRVLAAQEVAAALTFQALRGIVDAFDPRLLALRPHPGALEVGERLRALLAGSALTTRAGAVRVQDAYSLRALPQVLGGVRDALTHVVRVLTVEANAATDNPLVLAEGEGEVVSGANFHGSPVALVADLLPIALAQAAAMGERRVERLVNPTLSEGLPPFLTEQPGLHSGLMVAQYTAAAQVAALRVLAHPAGVDSIPTSAGQEDYVSMGPVAAHKARRAASLLADVVAVECLAACRALDLLGPQDLSPATAAVHAQVRRWIPRVDGDAPLAEAIARLAEAARRGDLIAPAEEVLGRRLTAFAGRWEASP